LSAGSSSLDTFGKIDELEAELLALAAHWADLHAATVGGEGVRHPVPGMEPCSLHLR
jgi:hypothetical protein